MTLIDLGEVGFPPSEPDPPPPPRWLRRLDLRDGRELWHLPVHDSTRWTFIYDTDFTAAQRRCPGRASPGSARSAGTTARSRSSR